MAILQTSQLSLERCPHCSVDRPSLTLRHHVETSDYTGSLKRTWGLYVCHRCGGAVLTAAVHLNADVLQQFPKGEEVDPGIPERARHYLNQAIRSLNSPSGAVMLAASAVDAMLKAKNLREGSLYDRIDKAASDHVITADMAKWAHDVRLEANVPRHDDESDPLQTEADARRAVDFVQALGELMFVLPARVRKGREAAQKK